MSHRGRRIERITTVMMGMMAGLLLATSASDLSAAEVNELDPNQIWQRTVELVAGWSHTMVALVRRGYAEQPAAMLGMAVVALLPLLAMTNGIIRAVSRLAKAPARAREAAAAKAAHARAAAQMTAPAGPAWVEVEGRQGTRVRIGEFLHIGRSRDCDLALDEHGLAETHAIIRQTSDREFVIIDVSDPDNAGVIVNGERTLQAKLSDGDRIELGHVPVRFHQARRANGIVTSTDLRARIARRPGRGKIADTSANAAE